VRDSNESGKFHRARQERKKRQKVKNFYKEGELIKSGERETGERSQVGQEGQEDLTSGLFFNFVDDDLKNGFNGKEVPKRGGIMHVRR